MNESMTAVIKANSQRQLELLRQWAGHLRFDHHSASPSGTCTRRRRSAADEGGAPRPGKNGSGPRLPSETVNSDASLGRTEDEEEEEEDEDEEEEKEEDDEEEKEEEDEEEGVAEEEAEEERERRSALLCYATCALSHKENDEVRKRGRQGAIPLYMHQRTYASARMSLPAASTHSSMHPFSFFRQFIHHSLIYLFIISLNGAASSISRSSLKLYVRAEQTIRLRVSWWYRCFSAI
eukprot:GHVU01025769.1.p1 GENE.GHVU01025769.1~~GHVU01025769.1.p1  ORF type:complete len:236 (-),score=52.45 GHVU01025769.1:164-871(-)